ncbi:MAG TPA: NUDIX hydrolase [Chthoniobacterales bacterium]|nr:NUDIX hydrolase [Chthoniobacterales bacterium]
MNDEAAWVVTRSDILFRNPHVEVRDETVLIPGEDRPRDWTVVGRKKAVVVAPITTAGRFVLIHQARIPVRRWLWEFPAGQVDETRTPSREQLRRTALRELAEEAGYELTADGDLRYLGHYFPSQGFTDEENHLFVARPVRRNELGSQPDHAEAISDRKEFALDELRSMIADSTIQDANTLALFARMVTWGLA